VVDGEVITPPAFEEVFEGINELGIHGLCVPRELGGMNAPLMVFQMNQEMLARADVSVCAHAGFHGGIAMAALSYSIREGSTTFQLDPPRILDTRFADCIAEIAAGEAWGSMDITEPGAGSDMAALRTRGEVDEDGNWFVTGQKIFITSGHGKWHFVIARTEETGEGAFDGLKGLSMFLVPAYRDEEDGTRTWLATIDGTEEKLGHNGSATVSISFERTPAMLIGERGDGFKLMLVLMNNARVGVGFESVGLSEAAYRKAAAFAAERPSMGKTIDKHEMIADMLEEMRTDIQASRAMCMAAGLDEELAQKIDMRMRFNPPTTPELADELESTKKRCQRRARKLTPLLKWFAAEKAVEIARRSVQIHGGSGYIKEYGVEKLLRDAMVFPIYEGTSQIQALMAMKDNLLAVVKRPGDFVRRMATARWNSLRAPDPMFRRVAALELRSLQAIQFLLSRLAANKFKELRMSNVAAWSKQLQDVDPKRDFALAMLHAERLTSLLTDAAVAELLWEQVAIDEGRRELLERWLDRAEPRSRFKYDEITTTGLRLLRELSGEDDEMAQAAK
jgi:alkylation response protein AidB-like acyl-CoA dehydrogenase